MNDLDALTRLAFLGTAHAPEPDSLGGVEGQTARALSALSVEKRVLLAAGARGVARAAGGRLSQLGPPGEAAPPDTLEVCPPRVSALLVEVMAAADAEMLRAILERMAHVRRRLPPELLPRLLGFKGPMREAIVPVLGERGQWLARLHPEWRSARTGTGTSPEEAERVWAEGTFEERRTMLEQTRLTEPARARAWLQGTFAQEKSDHRVRFLSSLKQGLSPEDEALLELGRKDRAAGVREVARELLSRLPTSAFARRMEERARAVLHWEAPGTIRVRFPAKWDAEAERDGLDKPPAGIGQSEHWLQRLLSALPLSTWENAFGATPEQLVAAAGRSEDGIGVSVGWAHAMHLGASPAWASALFDFWARQNPKVLPPERAENLASTLFEALPPPERAGHTLRVFRGAQALPPLERALALTPAPWPEELARAWLSALRQQHDATPRALALLGVLSRSALILPAACLAAAAEPIDLPAPLSYWQRELHRFQTSVSLCRTLHEELKP
ncbi:hypothetical protein D187_008686 [Cystobacter fuscus DSM 2262]|uniref:Uncharacterized protein n=1 Tax=Cystobacter fuscus (strain ATCC 25194 / DSM 2262 / NBRC 100088 / M29) TaxID=1242864 RepID=S9R0Q9_CYSF2|nr:DUF5691 domain-containing protein [Cystobacter fuscus]EPX62498.1 hypothetical protein D187_008686 [Cystobacter fuscus DSM 2262]